MKLLELRREVYEANMQIELQGLAKMTWGNVSQVDRREGIMAIKPSGVAYGQLSPENIVLVDFDAVVVDSAYKPSSDTLTHLLLYRELLEIGGLAHSHSTYACAWAQAQRDIPILGTTHADYSSGRVPCTAVMSDEAIQGDYEVATGQQILDCLGDWDYRELEMILVACHGPFTWGKDGMKAIENAVVLEEVAKMAFLSLQLNPGLGDLKDSLKAKHYYRKHGKDAYYGQ